ncbi:MAG: S24 family peptidase [Candidatus Dojkabacteria bacterium]|nr:MAG: S24 family peptidase [Candidatus Dojkabacteria bacterium]
MEIHPLQAKILKISQTQDVDDISLRMLSRLIGSDSPQKTKHHLEQLKKHGLLGGKKKAIRKETSLFGTPHSLVEIPILGSANCGQALISPEEGVRDYLTVSERFLPKKTNIFAVEAKGDSMNLSKIGPEGKNIEENDYVIIDAGDRSPRNGDYVLSIINGFGNIKKFSQKGNTIVLKSESTKNYPPIILHPDDNIEYFVNGRVIQVIKQ